MTYVVRCVFLGVSSALRRCRDNTGEASTPSGGQRDNITTSVRRSKQLTMAAEVKNAMVITVGLLKADSYP